jgi:hypothetical protein
MAVEVGVKSSTSPSSLRFAEYRTSNKAAAKFGIAAAGRRQHAKKEEPMSQSPEKTGVETPAIESLVKLGYTHLPGHTVQMEHRHLPQYLRMCCIPGC